MIFYHATTPEGWAAIQKEGVLWGVRDPIRGDRDNYVDGCWQCRVYEPIPLSAVTLLETNSTPHWTENELHREI